MWVTVIYSVASAAAVLFAVRAALRLARDRSLTLAVSVMSMTALSASLGLAAAFPAALQGEPGPAAWASSGLGVLGTWGLAQVLAALNGGGCRLADMVMTPVLGGASAAFLLLGLQRAGSSGVQEAAPSGLAVIGAQLSLMTYYGPGLCRIAVLARQRANSAHDHCARAGMRAVSASAGAEFILILARSAVTVAGSCGLQASRLVMTVIAVLQGVAVVNGTMAAGSAATLPSSRWRLWLAYWQLRPLWAMMLQAVPQVGLPAGRRARLGVRWRLIRRVIEIRDAELALTPYWRADVAARASVAARSVALSADLEQAVVEAAVIMDAADARMHGKPPARELVPAERVFGMAGKDLHSEVARLVQVARVVRRCPAIRGPATKTAPRLPRRGSSALACGQARPGIGTGIGTGPLRAACHERQPSPVLSIRNTLSGLAATGT